MTPQRRLDGTEIFPIGLGATPMSLPGRPGEERSVRTINAAVDAGVTLIDTPDASCAGEEEVGHNERLLARAMADRPGARDEVLLATPGGHTRPGGAWEIAASPAHLRAACEASLRVLATDRIDLHQLHRPDPDVAIAESVGALEDRRDEGEVHWIGLPNVQQVAPAWLRSLSDTVVPIPGSSRPETVTDSLAAARLKRAPEELDAIGATPAG